MTLSYEDALSLCLLVHLLKILFSGIFNAMVVGYWLVYYHHRFLGMASLPILAKHWLAQ